MKILASDFDNTIYYLPEDPRSKYTKDNIDSINDFINQGNIFIIITGRNYSDLKVLLNKLGLKYSYLVCLDGAKIFNNVDYCIHTKLMEPKEIVKIKNILDNIDCKYYLDDGYNTTENINDTVKVVVETRDEDEKDRIVNEVKKEVDIHVYKSRFHVNLIDKSVNKRDGLKILFNLEELDYNNLSCIGDNDNDYTMLKEFDSVVMKDHHKDLDELKLKEYKTIKEYIEELSS